MNGLELIGSRCTRLGGRLASICVALLLAMASSAGAQQSFKTPKDAAEGLVTAVRSDDLKSILIVLGRGGVDIVSSGDEVEDAATRKRFLAAYDEKNQITVAKDGTAILVVGQDDFPFPIPLVQRRGIWQFDTIAGRREILYRRIGRNELDAIQSCLAYADAQYEYAERNPTSARIAPYAQRIVSQGDKKDGLYWPTSPGENPSPLGELVAQATGEGYQIGGGRAPFRGYYFKILTRQGWAAIGGALDYVVRGNMIGGFALVAYPAQYRNSGVMTFIVNHDGMVFEKDLGRNTARLAERMESFNPDRTWKKVSVSLPLP